MKIYSKDVEVLAPAGSYDILTAVIEAGADAVYLGGDLFGARAFAGNFNKEELIRALDYAHMRDRRIYMTVNTLLKEDELNNYLVDYIAPYYEAGLDAAIVQDLGVFATLKKNFPDLHLHASTQMTVTGSKGAKLLKELGASRIVTARELNLAEIEAIRDECDIEIESFVHGALCYCYSGQCLLSSMNGGRSGNRGRCAQPCRLAYDVSDEKGAVINKKNDSYALSPKDMCALTILPDVIDAGVNSLKIEGRMKNVTYAAGVTSMYRKYVDMYLANGRDGYKVSKQDINDLMDIYNRGAFTTGYYNNDKGRHMMSAERPNHMGTAALEVLDNNSGRITFKALTEISRQDVFEVDADNSFSSGDNYKKGDKFVVNLPKKYPLWKGKTVYRTRNNRITLEVAERYVNTRKKIPVELSLFAQAGSELCLTMQLSDDRQTTAYVTGDIVQPALKQPADKEKLAAQISKLGNTDFEAKAVNIELVGDVFIPVSALNDIKRKCADELINQILANHKRTYEGIVKEMADTTENIDGKLQKSVLVKTKNQLIQACNNGDIKYIYIDFSLFRLEENFDELLKSAINECHKSQTDKRFALALPHILRGKNVAKCKELIERAADLGIDSYLVRCLEEIGLLSELAANNNNIPKDIIADFGLYCWNSEAVKTFAGLADKAGLKLIRITYPYELTADELQKMKEAGRTRVMVADYSGEIYNIEHELIVYSKVPMMISEQCVKRTYGRCDVSNGQIYIKDRKGVTNMVKSVCDYCYSILYSNEYNLTGSAELIDNLAPDYVRFELMEDTEEGLEQLLDNVLEGVEKSSWNGHFTIGVE